jgi:GGDEF domain-containing protein
MEIELHQFASRYRALLERYLCYRLGESEFARAVETLTAQTAAEILRDFRLSL